MKGHGEAPEVSVTFDSFPTLPSIVSATLESSSTPPSHSPAHIILLPDDRQVSLTRFRKNSACDFRSILYSFRHDQPKLRPLAKMRCLIANNFPCIQNGETTGGMAPPYIGPFYKLKFNLKLHDYRQPCIEFDELQTSYSAMPAIYQKEWTTQILCTVGKRIVRHQQIYCGLMSRDA